MGSPASSSPKPRQDVSRQLVTRPRFLMIAGILVAEARVGT
jgi:hypothetical protein